MLGDVTQDFMQIGHGYPFSFLLAGITFLLLLWLEHLGTEVYQHKGENNRSFAILSLIMLSIHSFLAGAALGLSVQYSVIIVLLLAIVMHKWAEAFALAVQITKATLPISVGIMLFLIFTLMTLLGILLGSVATYNIQKIPLLEPIFSAMAAGTFLYLGTLHGLSRAVMIKKIL